MLNGSCLISSLDNLNERIHYMVAIYDKYDSNTPFANSRLDSKTIHF